jgi:hypothetical protein
MEKPVQRDPSEPFRRHFEFDDWPAPSGERSFVWRFRLERVAIPGMRPVRVASPPEPGQIMATMSVWRPSGEPGTDEDASTGAILVDVWECPSAATAREQLLALLGHFESAEVAQRDGPGEVAFGYGDDAVAFVRGNITARVLRAGDGDAPVPAAATSLDRTLVERPDPGRALIRPDVQARAERPADGSIPLTVDAKDPRERPLTLAFFSGTGEVRLRDGRPVFVPDGAGHHAIDVYAVAPDGDSAASRVEIDTDGAAAQT